MIKTLDILLDGLNDEQKQAVKNPLLSCTKIVAGAGTGKTKIISKRFTKLTLDLISENIDTPTSKILVITFTDKAANEMKERIIKELNVNNLNSFENDLWVSTFHGFCNKILRKHAIEVNLSPDFELAEENTLSEIYQDLVRTIKYNEFQSLNNIDEICTELSLNSEVLNIKNLNRLSQIASLDIIFEDILKTIKKIKSLGLTPKEFLQQTLTASENYNETVASLPFSGKTPDEYVINWQNHLKPYIDDFCIFEKENTFDELCKKPILICKNRSSKAEKWTPAEEFYENLDNFFDIETYLTKVIALIYALYQKTLENKNIVDFDDLINKTVYILKNNVLIRTYYQKFFKHLIIDEFQDTNGAQLELIKLLLNEEQPNITFVGDRKQSIYGFRYAQMENIEVLHKYIENKYAQKYPQIKLLTNYRSSNQILQTINYVTKENMKLDEALYTPQVAQDSESKNFVKNTKIIGQTNAGEINIAEAKYIASEIKRLKQTEKSNYNDFAILVKSHSQSELIEKILTSYGIPSIKRTNRTFFESPVIKNAICALRLIKNPRDEIALTRILKIKLSDKKLLEIKNKIDKTLAEKKLTLSTPYPNLCDKIITLYENGVFIDTYLKSIFDVVSFAIKEKTHSSILQLFLDFENKINLHNPQNQIEQIQNETNLRILEKIISDFEQKKSYTSISGFLDYLEKISTDRNFELPSVLSGEIDAVQILTIHASKGLEFPYTFVCHISNKTQPDKNNIIFDLQYGNKKGFGLLVTKLNEKESPKSFLYKSIWKKPRDLSENIRLFYVAISRAEKYLNILTFEDISKNKPAPYTKDFPSIVTSAEINPAEIVIEKTLTPINQTSIPQEQFTAEIVPTKIQELKIHKFSFSKLNTFHTCPNKFLLKYKYGFTSLRPRNIGAEIGTIIHKLIYNSLTNKMEMEQSDISAILSKYSINSETKNAVLMCYKSFLQCDFAPAKIKNSNFFAEKPFKFEYTLKDRTIEFKGDIDLLIENTDNTYSIIDFKTNSQLKEADKKIYYNQLYLYKKAMEKEGLKIKSTMIISLNENNPSTIELTDENKIEKEFNELLEAAIEHFEIGELTTQKQNCCSCEYLYACL